MQLWMMNGSLTVAYMADARIDSQFAKGSYTIFEASVLQLGKGLLLFLNTAGKYKMRIDSRYMNIR